MVLSLDHRYCCNFSCDMEWQKHSDRLEIYFTKEKSKLGRKGFMELGLGLRHCCSLVAKSTSKRTVVD
jgi:hypothetical protein